MIKDLSDSESMPFLPVLRWESVNVWVLSIADSVAGHVNGHFFGGDEWLVQIAEADVDDAQTIIDAEIWALELFC